MAIQKRFIHFKKFSDFNSKKLSANEANTQYTIGVSGEVQTGAPDILYQSYCWIKDTNQQWTHGQLYDCNPNADANSSVYITPFTLNDIERTYREEITSIQWDYQTMMDAIHDNATILIPYGSDLPGYSMVGACYYEDRIYFTIPTLDVRTEYAIDAGIGSEAIGTSDIRYFDVLGKQDKLISGENIKTINGESLLGEGDITTPTFLRIGDADDEAKANFIAVANGEKSADYYICSSRVQGVPVDGIVTILKLDGPTGSPVYVSYTFYGSPMQGGLANKLLKITTKLTVSTGVITTTYEAVLDAKQDTITDLEDIREGAAKGATAVQPEDIEDEVYIADFTMESLMNGMNNDSQVDCDMQALVAAMNANKIILVRESTYSDYKGAYVLNGYAEDLLYFSIVLHQGDVLYCEGTVYGDYQQFIDGRTLYVQSWADKQDALVSGENIKTINGKSLIGSGDIAPSGYERKLTFSPGQTCGLSVDNKHMLTNILSGLLTIQLPTTNPTSDNYTKECGITFTTGATAPTIIFKGNIWWVNGTAPAIDANCVYEFSFKFNFANNMWLGVYTSFKTA